jgi:hypothetical protein
MLLSVCLLMSRDHLLGVEALQAPCGYRHEGERNTRNEVLFRALEDDVQPPVCGSTTRRIVRLWRR